jgi:hemerythrin-like domain-containing protein
MEYNKIANLSANKATQSKRREFLKKGLVLSAIGISGASLLGGCMEKSGEEIAPAEDLMREHGLLSRILLIYDYTRDKIAHGEVYSSESVNSSAKIIRSFVEDYHEKLEEDFLFPRFQKANVLADMVLVLRTQHDVGRKLTDRIIQFTAEVNSGNNEDVNELSLLLENFNYMYRPHKAREDTVLFPAIRQVFSRKEYFDLGESFEEKEHELFGKKGFEGMVDKVSGIEKELGIYDLPQFTPVL